MTSAITFTAAMLLVLVLLFTAYASSKEDQLYERRKHMREQKRRKAEGWKSIFERTDLRKG